MDNRLPKTRDYGVNLCEGCFDKQREIDRLKEEVQQLRLKVCANQRKSAAGFFGLSTPSSQIPIKPDSLAENQAKSGGATRGHRGAGRQVFSKDEADERRIAKLDFVHFRLQSRAYLSGFPEMNGVFLSFPPRFSMFENS